MRTPPRTYVVAALMPVAVGAPADRGTVIRGRGAMVVIAVTSFLLSAPRSLPMGLTRRQGCTARFGRDLGPHRQARPVVAGEDTPFHQLARPRSRRGQLLPPPGVMTGSWTGGADRHL